MNDEQIKNIREKNLVITNKDIDDVIDSHDNDEDRVDDFIDRHITIIKKIAEIYPEYIGYMDKYDKTDLVNRLAMKEFMYRKKAEYYRLDLVRLLDELDKIKKEFVEKEKKRLEELLRLEEEKKKTEKKKVQRKPRVPKKVKEEKKETQEDQVETETNQ